MTETSKLVLQVDATSVKAGAASLDDLARAGGKAEQSTTALTKATNVLATAAKTAAAAFGAYKLIAFAKDAALLAARFETMGVVMRVAGNNAGYTMAQMEVFSKSLQKSGITMLQSRDALTQLATANIDLANASKLARSAQDLAVVGNVNSSEAFGRLIYGIKSGQTEILRTLGLNVQFEAGYKSMAAQLGTTTEKLTAQQKTLSRTNSALAEAARYQGIYEESMTTAGKAMTSLTRYWEDFKIKAGDAFLPTLADAVFNLTDALKSANVELDKAGSSGTIDRIGTGLASAFKVVYETVVVLGANVAYVFSAIGKEIGGIAAQAAALARLDFKGAAFIGEEMRKDADAARKAIDAFSDAVLNGAKKQAVAAKMTEAERIAAGAASKAASEAAEKAAAAAANRGEVAKKAAKEYESAIKSADDYIKKLKEETEEVGLSAEAVKVLAAARKAAEVPAGKAGDARRKAIIEGAEELALATKAAATIKERVDADRKRIEQMEQSNIGMAESNKKLEEENELIGLGEEAQHAITQARGAAVIAIKEEQLARIQNAVFMSREQIALEEEIRLLKERQELMGRKFVSGKAAKAAEEATSAWKSFYQDLERGLTDSLFRAFDSGKGFFKTLWDGIKNLFKTTSRRWWLLLPPWQLFLIQTFRKPALGVL
jgi:hypothetical protein